MKKITKICIFDFDKTLVRTPELEEIKVQYKEKTGKEWPYVGCWSKPESLDMNLFDIPIIKEAVLDYANQLGNEGTLMVLLTGRLKRLETEVKKILVSHNLIFDEYYFNSGGSTLESKLNTLTKLLERYPSVEAVEQWDDRLEHIPYFELWGKMNCQSGRLKDYQINVIIND